ncbi:unnamed protein product [Brugia timori]|uniref:KID domain-containing protein n=1 Tax=Brugia timori TaxID=42155 RepID=A0A0R3QGQ6_9BILA|nr:unnamed protein product [Brugia timori]
METSETFNLNANQTERENPNGQSVSSNSAGNQAQFAFSSNIDGAMNTAVRGGIQNFIRNILPNALGNMTSVQTGKKHTSLLVEHENGRHDELTQTGANASRRRHPAFSVHSHQQSGQSGQMQPSARAFLGSSTPAFHGPGIVGQVIVRTNGPANTEVIMTFLI